jgi:hypothetical protein
MMPPGVAAAAIGGYGSTTVSGRSNRLLMPVGPVRAFEIPGCLPHQYLRTT